MKRLHEEHQQNEYNDEVDLIEIFEAIWNKKFFIATLTSVFTTIAIIYALSLPNIYRSGAVMMPVQNEGMSGMLGQYSGMASLAGISLPQGGSSKSQEAIARIKSYEFFSNNFLPNIALEDLLAVKRWNHNNNTLSYDKKMYDIDSRKWIRKVNFPRTTIPSSQEAYQTYLEIISISEDKKTFFVSMSVEHFSPIIAKEWADLIINEIDSAMREINKREATKSVEFLNNFIPSVKYDEIKKALSSLQEEQLKRLMVIEANDSYVFKVLESPVASEMKSSPQRSLIVILGTILGLVFGTSIAIAQFYLNQKLY